MNHLANKSQNGFTKCKVLILCPFKGDAVEIINILMKDLKIKSQDQERF